MQRAHTQTHTCTRHQQPPLPHQEFAERYVQAYDWDYAGAAYCRAINVPRTEPLVF